MRLKTRQCITAGIVLAMMLLFLIPVLGGSVPMGVHIAWQILNAVWHDYNRDRKWKN